MEWNGIAGELKRGAVDQREKFRLHFDIDVGGQARNERHADSELGHRMFGLFRPIVEVDLAVDDLNIVEREARRRTGRAAGEFFDEILKIVFAIFIANHAHVGLDQPQFLDHRPQAKERAHFQIDEQFIEGKRGSVSLPLFHQKTADRCAHGERIDCDLLDRNRTVELIGQCAGDFAPDQWRCDQSEQNSDSEQDRSQPEDDLSSAWMPSDAEGLLADLMNV